MPVSAAVVADAHCATAGAGIHMTSHFRGPATFDGAKCPKLPAVDVLGAFYLWPMGIEHIGHFKPGFHPT
jgi:hypothetical protein